MGLFCFYLGLFFVFAGNPAHLNFGKGLGKVGFYSGMHIYTLYIKSIIKKMKHFLVSFS